MNRSVFLFLIAFWLSPAVHAGVIHYQFTGVVNQVTDPNGLVTGQIAVSDLITATVIIESTATDSNPGDPEIGAYSFSLSSPANNFSIGSANVSQSGLIELQIRDRTCGDTVDFNCSPAGTFDDQVIYTGAVVTGISGLNNGRFTWGLASSSQSSLSDDSIPLELLLSDWEEGNWRLTGTEFRVAGTMRSLAKAVPVPASMTLVATGLILLSCRVGRV